MFTLILGSDICSKIGSYSISGSKLVQFFSMHLILYCRQVLLKNWNVASLLFEYTGLYMLILLPQQPVTIFRDFLRSLLFVFP